MYRAWCPITYFLSSSHLGLMVSVFQEQEGCLDLCYSFASAQECLEPLKWQPVVSGLGSLRLAGRMKVPAGEEREGIKQELQFINSVPPTWP